MGEIIKFPGKPITYIGPNENPEDIKVDVNNIINVNFKDPPSKDSFDEHVRYIISLVVNGVNGSFVPAHMLIIKDTTNQYPGTNYWETTSIDILQTFTTPSGHEFTIEESHLEKVAEYFNKLNLQFQWKLNSTTKADIDENNQYHNVSLNYYTVFIRCLVSEEMLKNKYGEDTYINLINKPFDIYNPIIKNEDTDNQDKDTNN